MREALTINHKIYKFWIIKVHMEEMINIPKREYEKLKMQANIDVELLTQLIESFKDIKEGRIERVR